MRTGTELEVPLKSLFIAAGTSPNTIYESEHTGTFEMDGRSYRRHEPIAANGEWRLEPMSDRCWPKIGRPAPFTSYSRDGRHVTFYGDNHPVYAGNVVKAMASARDGYPYIVRLFEREIRNLDPGRQAERERALRAFQERLDEALCAEVVEVKRLTPTIIEVIVRAPMQARKFCPGQFYRVHNLETLAPTVEGTALASEGLALTGAWVDKERGLISLIALEMGSSSRLCALWKPGDPLVVMGVTGAPTDIPSGKTVMLLGGGLGNAVLFSIGKALRAAGNQVIYFAGYRNRHDVFKIAEVEAASDVIVWSVDPIPGAEPIPVTRPQDKSTVGNILEAVLAYARGELGETPIHLDDVDHIIAIGSDRMMAAVKEARHGDAEALSQSPSYRHRLHQLADAVHDEGRLRPVSLQAHRPRDRRGVLRLLLLQPGPGARPRRFPQPRRPPQTELRAGKALGDLAGLSFREGGAEAGVGVRQPPVSEQWPAHPRRTGQVSGSASCLGPPMSTSRPYGIMSASASSLRRLCASRSWDRAKTTSPRL